MNFGEIGMVSSRPLTWTSVSAFRMFSFGTLKWLSLIHICNGPMLVVENTYRISGHSKSDGNLYRTKEEINAWKEKCPIKYFRKFLVDNKLFTDEELNQIAENAKNQIQEAVEYAKNSPEPSVDDIYEDVYA